MPLPEVAKEDMADLIFAPVAAEEEPIRPAPPPRAPKIGTAELLARVAARPAQAEPPVEDVDRPSAEEVEKALDEIVAEILSDPEAAFRPLPILFQDFQFHCRLRRLGEVAQDMSLFRRRLALARAGVGVEGGEDDDWGRVIALSEVLPEEMQGVFLLVARAAREEAPCPSDAALAQAYGSHSPSRGRWLLSYMAERGLIVCETDFRGNRIVVVSGTGWRTKPAGGQPSLRAGRARSAAATSRAVTEALRRATD